MLARRLVERHGFVTALRKASDRTDRYRVASWDGTGPVVTHPGRWLVWSTVTKAILAMPVPAGHELDRDALWTAIRLGYLTPEGERVASAETPAAIAGAAA